jgi:protein phosphatase
MRIDLPVPCLVVLVGAAGAGKSTFAARLFAPEDVLSSDAYRALVAGDPADQGATKLAFSILHRELDRRLAARRTTIVDATNVTASARRSLTSRARRHGIPAIAIVLDLDPGLVQARNATRKGRIVPAEAVARQLEDLGRSMRDEGFADEGFAATHVVRTSAELDELTITRRTATAGYGT